MMEMGFQWLPKYTNDLENICVQVKQKKQMWSLFLRIKNIQCKKEKRKIISELKQHCRPANTVFRFSLPVTTVVWKTSALTFDTNLICS